MFLDSVRYLFRRYILGRRDLYAGPGDEMIEVAREGEQRRAFLRAGCIIPIRLQGDEFDSKAVVISISGSGVLLLSSNELKMHSDYRITGNFFEREFTLGVRINREDVALAEMQALCGYGAEITSISEENRKHIIESVFRQNRWLKDLLP